MGKSYTRVYVIERGLAIYIAIGVVIIVNRSEEAEGESVKGPLRPQRIEFIRGHVRDR